MLLSVVCVMVESCFSCQSVSVLVPGSGLGRLAYEIAKLGLSCSIA